MRVSEAFPSKYLGAEDLGGRSANVRISNVTMEMVDNTQKMIVSFVGKKKTMICNKTNATKIADIVRDDETDRWIDQVIELYPAEVDYQGKTVPAIRVRAPRTETQSREPARDTRREAPRDDRRAAPADDFAGDDRGHDDPPPPRRAAAAPSSRDMDDDIPF